MDDRIDDLIREEARDYNEPPAVPRAAMWERIEMARRSGAPVAAEVVPITTARRGRVAPLVRLGIGVAALLALGIGIGRKIERSESHVSPTVATSPAPRTTPDSAGGAGAPAQPMIGDVGRELASSPSAVRPRGEVPAVLASRTERRPGAEATAYDLALGQHLGQAETFLTLFRSSVRSGRMDPVAFATARQLLSTNRLLLDSRAGAEAGSRQLLQDLELVLAQIAQLGTASDSSDVHIVTDDMDRGDVLPRLRTAVPAGI